MTRDEFIRKCEKFLPSLRTEPPHSIVCRLTSMRDLLQKCQNIIVPREVYFDSIAELIPEQREFWLRCEATDRELFIGGMTALFSNLD